MQLDGIKAVGVLEFGRGIPDLDLNSGGSSSVGARKAEVPQPAPAPVPAPSSTRSQFTFVDPITKDELIAAVDSKDSRTVEIISHPTSLRVQLKIDSANADIGFIRDKEHTMTQNCEVQEELAGQFADPPAACPRGRYFQSGVRRLGESDRASGKIRGSSRGLPQRELSH
jgi:hypothetical protein